MRWIGLPALALMLLPAVAGAAPPASCPAPADLHDGWTVASPAREGLDPALICAIGPMLEKLDGADANGVVIVRHGTLVYEHYFAGKDERWPELNVGKPPQTVPHDANTLHDLQSVTKSVTAILVGIAHDRGYLKNIDAPALSFFPQYADLRTPDREKITVRDLLSMTSGLFWPNGNPLFPDTPDPYHLVLDQPIAAPPGKIWNYSNGGVEVIGAILTKITGQPIDQFAKAALFDPLGITDWQWGRLSNGAPAASWGLRLRPRDLAKIGQLVLNHGVWQEHRIVSAAWIKQMTAPHSNLPNWISGADAYGYFWWLGHASIDNRNIAWAAGLGHGGQWLCVVPSQDLVMVATAGPYMSDSYAAGHLALHTALRAAFSQRRSAVHGQSTAILVRGLRHLSPWPGLSRPSTTCGGTWQVHPRRPHTNQNVDARIRSGQSEFICCRGSAPGCPRRQGRFWRGRHAPGAGKIGKTWLRSLSAGSG